MRTRTIALAVLAAFVVSCRAPRERAAAWTAPPPAPAAPPIAAPQAVRPAYPPARRDAVVDVMHGTEVADPYRWLEQPDSPETRAWIEAQNALTRQYFDAIPRREAIRARLTELWNFERFGLPYRFGGRYVVPRNDGLVGSSRVDLQACKLEYSIVSPK